MTPLSTNTYSSGFSENAEMSSSKSLFFEKRLHIESQLVQQDSLDVLHDFEQIDLIIKE